MFPEIQFCWDLLLLAPGPRLVRGWLLLLALRLGLATAQKSLEEVPVQPGFDAHKVEGRWLTIQLSTSHRNLVLSTDSLKLSLYSIQTRDSGDMDFVLFEKGDGLCTGVNVTVHPAGLQGQYQGTLEGSIHIRFVSTNYRNLILYARFEDSEVINLWALLARRMLEDSTWLGEYLAFVEKFHLHKAPVFNSAGTCKLAMKMITKQMHGVEWLPASTSHPQEDTAKETVTTESCPEPEEGC